MRLDELARHATDSLLTGTTTDTTSGLAQLRRSSRRRTSARTAAAGVGVAVVLGGWLVVTDTDSGIPEPAAPVVQNGALLVTADNGYFRMVDGGGQSLDLPDNHFAYYDSEFTGDGREMVYTSTDGRVMAHDVVTGDARELRDCGKASGCFWAISPDGERLAVPVDDGIEVHTLDDGASELLRTPEAPGAYLAWSPDGEALLFSGAGGIYTVAADGTDVRRLVPLEGTPVDFPRVGWSPDGATIAFVESRPLEEPQGRHDLVETAYVLRLVDRDGEHLRTVQELGVCACAGLVSPDVAWAPDGTGIAFTKVSRIRARGVHLLNIASGTTRQVTPDDNGFLVWQPVNR